MKLTQKDVDALKLPAGKQRHILWDDEARGLGACIQGGKKTWVVRYAVKGTAKRRQITLAPIGALRLKDARLEAGKYLVTARQGRDLDLESKEAAAAKSQEREQQHQTRISTLIAEYLPDAERRFAWGSYKQEKSYLEKHWAPFHGRLAGDLKKAELAAHVRKLASERGPVSANRAMASLSRVFVFAVRQGWIDINPMVGLAKEKETSRRRTLDDEELVAIWKASRKFGEFGVIIRLLMLTGQRRTEVAEMTWPELSLDRAMWSLPGSRTKNGEDHQVPLSTLAMEELSVREQSGVHLFGSYGARGFTSWSWKKKLDEASGVTGWVIHDLRRTAVGGMSELGVRDLVVELVVNHRSGRLAGVAGVYNRAEHLEERTAALQRWSDHIEGLVTGSKKKVVNFPKRA